MAAIKANQKALRDDTTGGDALRQLALFSEENPNPVLRATNDGTVLYANAAAKPILHHWRCGVGEHIHGDCCDHVTETVASGRQRTYEHSIGDRVFLIDLVPVAGQDYVNVYARDVTERWRAEHKLQVLAQQRQLALDAARLGWWRYDPTTRIAYWDDGYRRIFGVGGHCRPNDEILSEIIHPDDLSDLWRRVEAALDPDDPKPYSAQYRIIRPDGEMRWIEAHGLATFAGEGPDRRAVDFAGTVEDITERKEVEEALRDYQEHIESLIKERTEELRLSEERFRTAFKSAAIGKAIVGLNGEWHQVNSALCDIIGYSEEELLAKTFQDITHPDDLQADLAQVRLLLEGRIKNYTMGRRYIRKDGQVVWILLSTSLVRNAKNQPIYFISEMQDITALKRAEESIRALNADLRRRQHELQDANQDLEAFAYSVSHDLRSPLRGVDGYSKLLLEDYRDRLDEDGRFMLAQICDGATEMGSLIDDLLTFSRMGRRDMQLLTCDVAEIVRETFHKVEQAEPDRRLRLELAELPICAADPTMIKEVVRNLVENAVKFTRPREEAVIEVGVWNAQQGADESDVEAGSEDVKIVYFVRDNGVGFDPRFTDKLFQVFQRLHRADEYEGTGIGLALVRRIVERHGGEVWAEGDTDKGATFYFTLPTVTGKESSHA